MAYNGDVVVGLRDAAATRIFDRAEDAICIVFVCAMRVGYTN